MMLDGLPDFQNCNADLRAACLPAFKEIGCYAVLPEKLRVADQTSKPGCPDIRLELFTGRAAEDPGGALLSFLLQADFSMRAAAESLGAAARWYQLKHAPFLSGWLDVRLPPALAAKDEEAFSKPLLLSPGGLGTFRCSYELTPSAGPVLEGMMRTGKLPLLAAGVVAILGVTPRANAQVQFDATTFQRKMKESKRDSGPIEWRLLLDLFNNSLEQAGFRWKGSAPGISTAQQALLVLDHLVARYGEWSHVEAQPDQTAGSRFQPAIRLREELRDRPSEVWNLSVPRGTWRPLALGVDPFDEHVTRIVADNPGQYIVRELPLDLDVGRRVVRVNAVFPPIWVGPNPRIRLRTDRDDKSRGLEPPWFSSRMTIDYSPLEDRFHYRWQLIVADGDGRSSTSEWKESSESWLHLDTSDLPVDVFTVALEAELFPFVKAVNGLWTTEIGKYDFELDANDPKITLLAPKGSTVAKLDLELLPSRPDWTAIRLNSLAPNSYQVGNALLPQGGVHTVDLKVVSGQTKENLVIELQSMGGIEGPTEIDRFTVSSPEPLLHWSYYVDNPFQPGYRYRYVEEDGEVGNWSDVLIPTKL